MRKVFKGKFMAVLKGLATSKTIELPNDLKEKLYRKKWVVYAKRPFAKPENIIEYLGRYTTNPPSPIIELSRSKTAK